MPRILRFALLGCLATALLAVSASASSGSAVKIRGTVAVKLTERGLVRVDSPRASHILRVLGSHERIRVGQRVELRGGTLRQRGHGSRVLARDVVVVSSSPRATQPGGSSRASDDQERDDRDDRGVDNSGPGRAGQDDDDDNSGPGKADDDSDDSDDSTADDSDDTTDTDDSTDDSTDDED